jgi:hypothetical protein
VKSSEAQRAGISERVRRRALYGLVLFCAGAAACDVRPLRSGELYATAPVDGGGRDVVPPDAGAFEASTEGSPEASTDASIDAASDVWSDADGSLCGPCAADQFCDELARACKPHSGTGMLSGVVIDKCGGIPLDALVGLAGHHVCSFPGKGSYFFTGLPLGKLELAVAKTGYDLYKVTVDIATGGVVYDVTLVRTGAGADGCGVPRPTEVACTCQAPTCLP